MRIYTREEYEQVKDGFWVKIVLIVLGGALGIALTYEADMDLILKVFLTIVIAGVPYAWSKVPFVAMGIYSLLIKVLIAFCFGWIITPVALAIDILRMNAYKKAMGLNQAERAEKVSEAHRAEEAEERRAI